MRRRTYHFNQHAACRQLPGEEQGRRSGCAPAGVSAANRFPRGIGRLISRLPGALNGGCSSGGLRASWKHPDRFAVAFQLAADGHKPGAQAEHGMAGGARGPAPALRPAGQPAAALNPNGPEDGLTVVAGDYHPHIVTGVHRSSLPLASRRQGCGGTSKWLLIN